MYMSEMCVSMKKHVAIKVNCGNKKKSTYLNSLRPV